MAVRITLKVINDELAKHGHKALLAKAEGGHFYFWSGDAVDWLDRTVNVPTLGALTIVRFRQGCVKGRQTSAQHLHDLEITRRYATLVAWYWKPKPL